MAVRVNHNNVTARRRGASEDQLLQTVEPVDQRVLIGHQLEVALIQTQYQLILLQLVTRYRT